MNIVECEQGTAEWFAARAGVISASMFSTARKTLKSGKPAATALDYAMQLACERIAGETLDNTFQTWQMKRGTELEAEARTAYEFRHDCDVAEVGFMLSDCGNFCGSPDGLIGDDGGIEIKCPIGASQLRKLFIDLDRTDYLDQVQGNLWISGRQWYDLVIYCPFLLPANRDLTVIRYERDESHIKQLEADLTVFNGLVNEYKAKIEN